MKKIICCYFIFFFCLIPLIAGSAKVIKLEGPVCVIKPDNSFDYINVGEVITENDVIITGMNSFCDIEFGEKVYSRIYPNTQVRITELKKKEASFLQREKVKVNINI